VFWAFKKERIHVSKKRGDKKIRSGKKGKKGQRSLNRHILVSLFNNLGKRKEYERCTKGSFKRRESVHPPEKRRPLNRRTTIFIGERKKILNGRLCDAGQSNGEPLRRQGG